MFAILSPWGCLTVVYEKECFMHRLVIPNTDVTRHQVVINVPFLVQSFQVAQELLHDLEHRVDCELVV